ISGTAISPDGKYIVSALRIWDQPSGKVSQHLTYTDTSSGATLDLTPDSKEVSDYNPMFNSSFKDFLFFVRSSKDGTHVYYIPFPNKNNEEPVQLTNYPIDIDNVKFQAAVLVFSAEVYTGCLTDLSCTAQKDKEVADRGS